MIRCQQRQVLDRQMRIIDKTDFVSGLIQTAVFAHQEFSKGVKAINPGGKLAEAFKIIDDHGQCAQYRRKCSSGLYCPSNFKLPGQHVAGNNRVGQDDGYQTEAILKKIQIQLRTY